MTNKYNDETLEKFRRVFFHEFGHLVCLIYHQNDGVRNSLSVSIHLENKVNGEINLIGKTHSKEILIVNEGKYINVAESLLGQVYGCYFECLYLNFKQIKIRFSDCFCQNRCSGRNDFISFFSKLNVQSNLHKQPVKKERIIHLIYNDCFQLIKKDEQQFKELFEIDIFKFLVEETDGYKFDLQKLTNEMSGFISNHKIIFQDCINLIEHEFNI